VYSIKRDKPLNIDPKTGELLTYDGKPYKEFSIKEYTDIDTSYAKEQINTLAQYGITLPGSEFKPKENIKQRELLYLIAKARYFYLDLPEEDESKFDENLYSYLINQGIVKEDEKAPDAIVTKEEAVKYIIRALNFSKVANIKDIYTVPFKDGDMIDPELKGHVAIAYGLKIVSGSNGYFNPSANITREQAAILVFNFLKNS